MREVPSFSFGRNWQRFLGTINDERVHAAKNSLCEFLGMRTLKNISFLDIGCGSGLFSYAAFLLGARKIVSFDLDPFSVQCCKYLHDKAENPRHWEIYEASILDKNFISQIGKYDVVYSWGVLHHTGDMWQAINNAASLVDKDGYFYFAIYNRVEGPRGSEFWLGMKRTYNAAPKIGKYLMEYVYMSKILVSSIVRDRKLMREIRGYASRRGMSWRTDISDWLGGYPYEFATVDEILGFMAKNCPGFKLTNVKRGEGLGNNWFLFKKS